MRTEAWPLLVDALTDAECSLTKIDIRDPGSEKSLDDLNQRFAEILNGNTSFTELTIFARALNSIKLCTAIDAHKRLKSLTVLGELDTNLFGRVLSTTKTIRHLSVTLTASALINMYKILKTSTSVCSVKATVTFVTNQQAAELIEVMKFNDTITHLIIEMPYHSEDRYKIMAFDDNFFEVNWALTECRIHNLAPVDVPSPAALAYLERNKKYQRDMLEKTIVLLYNLVRSKEALAPLPVELWVQIFSFLQYPGQQRKFDAIFETLLNNPSIRRVS